MKEVTLSKLKNGACKGYGKLRLMSFKPGTTLSTYFETHPISINGGEVRISTLLSPQERREKEKNIGRIRLVVERLKKDIPQNWLKSYFSVFGEIDSWNIQEKKKEPRNIGFITFKTPEDLDNCLAQRESILKETGYNVKRFEPRGKGRLKTKKTQPGQDPYKATF